MGSIFEIPSGLLFVLSLVTTNPSDVATAASGLAAPKSATAVALKDAPCRHGEQAWFAALKQGAGGVAFSSLAGRIFQTSGGRFYVPVAKDRADILKLQHDNAISCFIALSSAANNVHRLKHQLGRDVTLADLYIAHIFGADYALRILAAANATPNKRMSRLFPTLDAIEPRIYAGRGKTMTVGRFVKRITSSVQRQVYRARGKPQRRAKQQRQPRHSTKLAARRVNAIVQKANVSARDLLQQGPPASAPALNRAAESSLTRFMLGAGLRAILSETTPTQSKNYISF